MHVHEEGGVFTANQSANSQFKSSPAYLSLSLAHRKAIKKFLETIDELKPDIAEELWEFESICIRMKRTGELSVLTWYLLYSDLPEDDLLHDRLNQWVEDHNLKDTEDHGIYKDIAMLALDRALARRDSAQAGDTIRIRLADGVDLGLQSDSPWILSKDRPFVFTPTWERMRPTDPSGRPLSGFTNGKPNLNVQWEWDDVSHYQGLLDASHDRTPLGLAWNGLEKDWDEFNKQITAAFNSYKQAYKRYVTGGNSKRSEDHFKWLVLYQFDEEMSHSKIRKWHEKETGIEKTDRAIGIGLKKTAELCLLELRPAGKGGPKPRS